MLPRPFSTRSINVGQVHVRHPVPQLCIDRHWVHPPRAQVSRVKREVGKPRQLSRAVEVRSPHVPMLSDLRESGSIEQDADVVLFIYRDEVYYTEEDWARQFPDKEYPKGEADIIVAKHRNGPTGSVKVNFNARITKFENVEKVAERPTLL